jgi:hypothetical protein
MPRTPAMALGNLTAGSGTLSPLTADLHRGLTAVAFFASISLVSSSSLFLYLSYKLARWRIRASMRERTEREAAVDLQTVDLSLGLAPQHFGGVEEERLRQATLVQRRQRRRSPNQFLLLVYNLFLADTLQAIAFFLNAVWVAQDGVFVGTPACFIQGWLVSTGDLASSCFIFAIAVHTYLSVVRRYKPRQWALNLTIVGLWVFVYGMTIMGLAVTRNGASGGGYYVRASAWVRFSSSGLGLAGGSAFLSASVLREMLTSVLQCWINIAYEKYRLLNHYLFIFISLASTSLTYLLIFFHLRSQNQLGGSVVRSGGFSHSSRPSVVTLNESDSVHRPATAKDSQSSLHDIRRAALPSSRSQSAFNAADFSSSNPKSSYLSTTEAYAPDPEPGVEARRTQTRRQPHADLQGQAGYHPAFLLYPIIYVVCTLPLAVGRIATMAGLDVPYWYFCLSGALITSNGWLDCLLWGMTRRSLIFGSADDMDEESTGLDTFAFMRTPRGRQFGNMVWVQGAASFSLQPRQDAGRGAADDRWGGLGLFGIGIGKRKGVRLDGSELGGGRHGHGHGHGRSVSQESLRGADPTPRNERGDMAIQLDLVTSVVVEQDASSRDAAERYRRMHGLTASSSRKPSESVAAAGESDKEGRDMHFITGRFE